MFAWIFFRANSFSDALYVIGDSLVGAGDPLWYVYSGFKGFFFDLSKTGMALFALPCLLLAAYDWFAIKHDLPDMISRQKTYVRWVVYYFLVLGTIAYLIMFSSFSAQEFIYFQF